MKTLRSLVSSIIGNFSSKDALGKYCKSAPSAQNAIELFPGKWSTSLPGFEKWTGDALLFQDPRITWAAKQLGGF